MEYSSSGSLLETIAPSTSLDFQQPSGITVLQDGDLALADSSMTNLLVISPSGGGTLVSSIALQADATGVASNSSGDIFVSAGYVYEYSGSGTLLATHSCSEVDQPWRHDRELHQPRDLHQWQ